MKFALLIALFLITLFLPATNELNRSIPIRFIKGDILLREIEKEKVSIESERGKLLAELVQHKRSIQNSTQRVFIISFNAFTYFEKLEETIQQFMNNELKNGETLFLITPIKSYKFLKTEQFEDELEKIKKIINNDLLAYQGAINSASRNFFSQSAQRIDESADSIVNYLMTIKREINNFKQNFILNDASRWQYFPAQIRKEYKQNPIFWIHFQQREIYPELGMFNTNRARIRDFLTNAAGLEEQVRSSNINTNLKDAENNLRIQSNFPFSAVLNQLLLNDISLSILLYNTPHEFTKGSLLDTPPDLDTVYQKIALFSGGFSEISSDLSQAMQKIIQYEDCFYEIILPEQYNLSNNLTIKYKAKKTEVSYPLITQ